MHGIYRQIHGVWPVATRSLRYLGVLAAFILAVTLSMTGRCEADWVNSQSSGMPVDAIIAGEDPSGNPLYLCRAYYLNTVQPGYATAHASVCQFGYGGGAKTSTNFDWYIPSWIPAYGQAMPANAIPLGAEPAAGGAVYRYPCKTGNALGKYGQDLGGCLYPDGGRENDQPTNGFEWLVDPGNNIDPPTAATLTQPGPNLNIGPYTLAYGWPDNAMVAGLDYDGTPLYFCSVYFADGLQPGKARKDWNACDVGWGGQEHFVTAGFALLIPNYFDLLHDSGTCAAASGNTEPPQDCTLVVNPIPVGKDSDGSTLWACVAYSSDYGNWPGKTKQAWGRVCDYPLNGAEVWEQNEAVLTDGFLPSP